MNFIFGDPLFCFLYEFIECDTPSLLHHSQLPHKQINPVTILLHIQKIKVINLRHR